jgi:chromosome segregation ATPase
MAEKKKTIREEQNHLLKELEDLGLKMKDFDMLAGNSFKNFTVVSPFLTRFAQQLIKQLREVADNFSNKEMKEQIEGFLKAMEDEKAIKDELVSSILLNDPNRLSSTEEDFQLKISETLALQQEMVERSENLTNHLAKMEQELREAKEYQAKYEDLKDKKDRVCQAANQTGEDLETLLRQKAETEHKLKEIQARMQEKSETKLRLNNEINKFLDDYTAQFSGSLNEISKTLRNEATEESDEVYNFFQQLKRIEVSAHIDNTYNEQAEIEDTLLKLLQNCTAIQNILVRKEEQACSKEIQENIVRLGESALQGASSRLVDSFSKLLSSVAVLKRLSFSGRLSTVFPRLLVSANEFIERQKKFGKMYFELCGRKLKAVKEYKSMMEEALKLEQEAVLLNRKKAQIINFIPQIKSENKEINFQLQKLIG